MNSYEVGLTQTVTRLFDLSACWLAACCSAALFISGNIFGWNAVWYQHPPRVCTNTGVQKQIITSCFRVRVPCELARRRRSMGQRCWKEPLLTLHKMIYTEMTDFCEIIFWCANSFLFRSKLLMARRRSGFLHFGENYYKSRHMCWFLFNKRLSTTSQKCVHVNKVCQKQTTAARISGKVLEKCSYYLISYVYCLRLGENLGDLKLSEGLLWS